MTSTPSKPVQTTVPVDQLVAHYNSQLQAYREMRSASPTAPEMLPLDPASTHKEQAIDLIRKQNHRLGRFIRHRSIALLQAVVRTNEDGRTVGHSYAEILDILAVEFPEASTSPACLRWYVVHLWSEADEEGLPRPKMPQLRPRSVRAKKPANGNQPLPLAAAAA